MAAQLQIDQERLTFGAPGTSRTDGDDDGSIVTLTNTGSGSTTTFRLLWTPPGDTTAVATLAATEDDPKVWTFEPTPERYGSYLIELIEDEGLVTEVRERRVFVVRTPVRGLVIPALNERGDPRASLVLSGTVQLEAAVNNAVDYTSEAFLNDIPYAAWWRSLHELTMAVDSSNSAAGAISPFSNIRYVDQRAGLPSDEQTGAINAPFTSLQAAIDAIPPIEDLDGPQGGVLLVVGHDYSSESLALPSNMAIVAVGARENPAGRVLIGNIDCAGSDLVLTGVEVAGAVSNAGTITAKDSILHSSIQATTGLRCTNCELHGQISTDFLALEYCPSITGNIEMGGGRILYSELLSPTVTANSLDIDRYTQARATGFPGVNFVVPSGVLVLDRAGTFSTPEQLEVFVPELIGSATSTQDIVVTGTPLEGIDTQNLVLANPADDDAAFLLRSVRVVGFDTLRFELRGPYAGGPVFFMVSRLY